MANLSALRQFKIGDLNFQSFKNGFFDADDSNPDGKFYVYGDPVGFVTPVVTVYGEDFDYLPSHPDRGEIPFDGLVTGLQVGGFIGSSYQNFFIAANVRASVEKIGQVGATKTLTDDVALVKQILARADVFSGSDGDDHLATFAGNDTLDGGKGADTLDGGTGVDTVSYEFAQRGVRVFLDSTEGTNTGDALKDVFISIENIRGSDNAASADSIHGDARANVINGLAGKDQLWGGGGADSFEFTSPIAASNVDALRDFEHGVDKIKLDDDIFTGITFGRTGVMAARNFYDGGSAAHDRDDRIIYNSETGRLFYDPDGNTPGGVAAKLIAIISKVDGEYPELSQTDFFRL